MTDKQQKMTIKKINTLNKELKFRISFGSPHHKIANNFVELDNWVFPRSGVVFYW